MGVKVAVWHGEKVRVGVGELLVVEEVVEDPVISPVWVRSGEEVLVAASNGGEGVMVGVPVPPSTLPEGIGVGVPAEEGLGVSVVAAD